MPKRKPTKTKRKPTAFDLEMEARAQRRKEQLNQTIDEFLTWTAEHPSVHDRMPHDV